jgi:putative addiction module CopG family antidote
VQSKYVGTTRRVITSTLPGDTGNESRIAKQRSFAQIHSASGIAEKGEGIGEMASGCRPAVYEPDGQPRSRVKSGRQPGIDTEKARMYTSKTMTVDMPAELAPFVERLIAERRFLTESEVLAEGLRLLQSQETLRAAVRQGFAQLDEGKSSAADTVLARAEERIAAIERAGRG